MAPLLGSPMTPSPSSVKSNPTRRVVPIVPAIPRSLERNPKGQVFKPKSQEPQGISSSSGREGNENCPVNEDSVTPTQDPQSDAKSETVAGADIEAVDLEASETLPGGIERGYGDTKIPSPGSIQDFGIEKHGFKLPPPFFPRKSPPTAISTDLPSADEHTDTLQESAHSTEENTAQRETTVKRMSLRGSAPSFHAHPRPSSDTMTSSTPPSSKDFPVGQSISFHSEHTPPTDVTPSPTHSYQGHDDSHRITFSSPQPASSNNASSPAHSVYQGYLYGPAPYGYSPEIRTIRQSPVFDRVGPEGRVYSKQHDDVGPPYYSQPPAFPPLGSQPPLTPSATPFSNMPQQSNYLNGYLPTPLDYNYATQLLDLQSQSGYPGYNTSKSGGSTSPIDGQGDTARGMRQADMYQSQIWPTTMLNNARYPPVNSTFNQSPIVAHLLRNFNLPEYADCRLLLTHKDERFEATQLFLSTLLLAQSAKLREMIQTSKSGTDGRKLITLTLTDRFITPKSLQSALRVCYGESPCRFAGMDPQDQFTKTRTEFLTSWMKETLSYAAAGCLLQMDSVVSRGLDIASKILSWENLETALSFGLESESERGKSASVNVIPAYRSRHPIENQHSSSCAFNATQQDEAPVTNDSSITPSSTSSSDDYPPPQPQSGFDLLMHCLRFLIENFPESWKLDVSARPLADVDRLPVTAESRSPLSKSRLCCIQFGDRPSEATAMSADRNVLLSMILLSLPYIWLEYLLKSVGEPIRCNIVSIVKERERRRQVVLRSQSVSRKQREAAKDYEWAEAGYEESVQLFDEGEVTLSRRYTGITHDLADDKTDTKV